MELFHTCRSCGKPTLHNIKHIIGSLICILQDCVFCKTTRTWSSQPYVRDMPAGNLLMSATILISGSLPSKTLLCWKFMGLQTISDDTFFDHQRAFLHPAIESVWEDSQQRYISEMQKSNKPLVLGGDGRLDSPGHSAKFGTYTLMDLNKLQVVDVRTVQSNEAGNSNLMEKQGFLLSLQFIDKHQLSIAEFVSDRHPQIMKYMREQRSEVKHSIDVWHVAKGLKKKLLSLSKEKECEQLSGWIKSIINHLYWIPVHTRLTDDANLKQAIWISLGNHIHNVHEHHVNPQFPACLHSQLVGNDRNKMWIKPGSKLSVKFEPILESKQLMKDIPMLSTGPQTAAIESFHAAVNRFAPKMIGFQFEGIAHRVILAALHFNENIKRKQATTESGVKRFNLSFRKSKKDFCLQEVKVQRTYDYAQKVLTRVSCLASTYSKKKMEAKVKENASRKQHTPLCSSYVKPTVADAVANVQSRYS